METREKKRRKLLDGVAIVVRNSMDEINDDDELKQVFMKMYLDLKKKIKVMAPFSEGEEV